jgi:hypothetical protein
MFQTIAIHHAVPEHADAFLAFMGRVTEAVAGAPGLLEFSSWREPGEGGRLVAVARWESPEAFQAAAPRIMSLSGERRPEWSSAPDDLLMLAAAGSA